jgi:endoglucanase
MSPDSFMVVKSLLVSALALLVALGCSAPTAAVPARASSDAAESAGAAPTAAASTIAPNESPAPWWGPPAAQTPFDPSRLSHAVPRIHVEGNRFVDEAGATVIFQGVNIADPDNLIREGHWSRELFQVIASWGANIVRVPVHPAAFRGRGAEAYFALLDDAVVWANESGLYLIVDWHSIGNLVMGLYQRSLYDTTQPETFEFWRATAARYAKVPTVALYEIFNEPTVMNGRLGTASWQQWKALNEQIIDLIYANSPAAVPLVAGFDWAYDLRPVAEAPIERKGVAYVTHPYPQKTHPPYPAKWDERFGFVAAKYPLIATEIGYMPPDARGAHSPAVDTASYGVDVTAYLASKGASWVAWCFHPDWAPQLLEDWSYTPTAAGAYFRDVMLKHADKAGARGPENGTAPLSRP